MLEKKKDGRLVECTGNQDYAVFSCSMAGKKTQDFIVTKGFNPKSEYSVFKKK